MVPTELILTHPRGSLGKIQLEWTPQPGNYIDVQGKTYLVLERHHHYQYKVGGYCLEQISLIVQLAERPIETSDFEGRLVIGDSSCSYNAGSEILRCAVNPEGPCEGCRFYVPIEEY